MKLHDLSEKLEKYSQPEPNSGCILWLKSSNTAGYGFVYHNNKMKMAHRAAWELKNGPIPIGKILMHSCDIRCCINPNHLSIGTQQENVADMVRKGRYHLKYKRRKERISHQKYLLSRPPLGA